VDPARLDDPLPDSGAVSGGLLNPPAYIPEPRRKFQDKVWVHVLLLVLTFVSATWVGAYQYEAFLADFAPTLPPGVSLGLPLVFYGLWNSATVLAILGCHELGHYFACRYYDVDASLPFFLPMPLNIVGTLGAVIKIREPIRMKRTLFDIGIAGPIAGFLVAVPALFIGVSLSHVVRIPADFQGFELGEPLLFKLASSLIWGRIPEGYSLNMHPLAFAAWFGLLATALNLFPIGQLDGGHISYAVFGRRSVYVTLATFGTNLVLAYFYSSAKAWTVLFAIMLFLWGPWHPRVFDEHEPLDRARMWLALGALAMFVLCFTPAPLEPLLGGGR
jgi:membrane-associated protease RseP (regulator of RpoE activity)